MTTPRLRTLAAIINADPRGIFTAEISVAHVSTDRHPKGVRWRISGKGRTGNRLIVKEHDGTGGVKIVLDHNSAETYRRNEEVVDWMNRNGIKVPQTRETRQ